MQVFVNNYRHSEKILNIMEIDFRKRLTSLQYGLYRVFFSFDLKAV